MSTWAVVNPAWQNFSSLIREATTSLHAKTRMERSHHLTASLYFGIAALEAFINQQMRTHLARKKTDEEVFDILRRGQIISKLKKWPADLLPRPMKLTAGTLDLIALFNDIRGDLTHPKSDGPDIYAKLEGVDPNSVIDAVSEYIVRFHEAKGNRYPYWIFGWNYLNPRPDGYDIFMYGDHQFYVSLHWLGLKRIELQIESETWRNRFLRSFDGYIALKQELAGLEHCQPKHDEYPFMPILCRRWWTAEHHLSCGHVTDKALGGARRKGASQETH